MNGQTEKGRNSERKKNMSEVLKFENSEGLNNQLMPQSLTLQELVKWLQVFVARLEEKIVSSEPQKVFICSLFILQCWKYVVSNCLKLL